jgi:hypothetical protein
VTFVEARLPATFVFLDRFAIKPGQTSQRVGFTAKAQSIHRFGISDWISALERLAAVPSAAHVLSSSIALAKTANKARCGQKNHQLLGRFSLAEFEQENCNVQTIVRRYAHGDQC